MILVADSGSSKTNWALIGPNGEYEELQSTGLNPYHISDADILGVLTGLFGDNPILASRGRLYFYGAGCKLAPMSERVLKVLSQFFANWQVKVFPDTLAAARALHGPNQGIVAIVGTGVNSAFYNGQSLVYNTPSLGYIIGDEGSGCYLGKELLRSWQYGELPQELAEKLTAYTDNISLAEILQRVYGTNSERFLSQLVPFIVEQINHPCIGELVDNAFNLFVERHLIKLPNFTTSQVGVVGSVGYHLQVNLKRAVKAHGGRIGKVLQYPIDELVQYHLNHQ